MKFKVHILRTGYGHREIEIDASDEKEATTKAMDTAGDYEFSEKDSEHIIESTEIVKKIQCKCQIKIVGDKHIIDYCPIHEAAPELFEICRQSVSFLDHPKKYKCTIEATDDFEKMIERQYKPAKKLLLEIREKEKSRDLTA